MLQVILLILLPLITMGCGGPRYVDYFPYHDDGTIKPRVALLSMKNSTQSGLPWDVSQELSEALYYELMNSGQLYVLSAEEVGPIWGQQNTINFFDGDMSFTPQFCNADFIVAWELIDHSTVLYDPSLVDSRSFPQCHPANRILNMSIRVKVIDVRFQQPHVILYEIVNNSYNVTPSNNCNYEQMGWGCKDYNLTPCARAHQRMVCSLASRLEEVLCCAK